MVNIDAFIKRLEKILDYYNLNASTFADKIGVQRSSMSHLLSGRNKPSLDFILKITEVFPEVDLYWIINGKGNFPKNYLTEDAISKPLQDLNSNNTPPPLYTKKEDLFSDIENIENEFDFPISPSNNLKEENEIEKIVVFYKNGKFKLYKP
ncbi:helix-turn-helix domain-containing protein [Flavobacterium agrisoli]|uniref:Helix-turn-helix transcriptional regulator n=1 Tax=Flavobacterium agrisoli TaxID=2793066 RepID=A0A934PJF7_9FLAO|nr:helix-turn-helix transcriptional regulator [Flavobacterium agrisoli]MBK0368499.1 helix-turn-helix transcriptional regulator [Flavobacterium agrisoli]